MIFFIKRQKELINFFFIPEHTEAPVKPNEKSGQDKIASTKKETKINTGGTKKRRRKTGATSGTTGKISTNPF